MCDATIIIEEVIEPKTLIISDDCNETTIVINETFTPVTVEVCDLGAEGLSAYQIAVANGFVGTEVQWLASLQGTNGVGVPIGGTINQVLKKINSTNYNTEWVTINKEFVGLNNVDNTSDVNKPISTATKNYVDQQDALKVDKVTGYSLTKNDLTDALKSIYDNTVSSLTTLLATGLRLITSAEITKLNNTSGVNTGDQDLSGLTPNTRLISTTSPLQGGGDLSANRTLSILQSNTTQSGFLSNTDWNAFNGKFNLPSLTSGSVLFSNGTTIAQDNANFFWDNTNKRLGIGTAIPSLGLDTRGGFNLYTSLGTHFLTSSSASSIDSTLKFTRVNSENGWYRFKLGSGLEIASDNISGECRFGVPSGGFFTTLYSNGIERIRINAAGNTLINTTTDNGGKLQIKAPGALSTDIALRVRNSADTADLLSLNGFNGGLLRQGGGVGNITYGVDIAGQLEVGSAAYLRGANYMNNGALIGADASQDASSLLEVRSTTKGFLPPRMTTTQKNAIVSPATGLIVYDNNLLSLFQYNGTTWVDLKTSVSLTTSGFGENVSYNSTTNQLTIDKYSWMDLARGYTVEPTLFTATSTYEVYTYTYTTSTFYRRIMFDNSQDAFYSESGLINLLCTKKIIL